MSGKTKTFKVSKPGQLITYREILYRAKHAKNGCQGCALNKPFMCPNIKYANATQEIEICCKENLIIFERA